MRFREWFLPPDPIEIKSGIASPEPWLTDMFGGLPLSSGVTVTPHNAMQCPAVACAVKAIAETIGQLPVHVYERGADGSKERVPAHPVYRLVHDEVNDWTSASELREALTVDALLHEKGGFAFINRLDGRPVELHRLAPESVTVETHDSEPSYRVALGDNRTRVYRYRDILHLRGIGSPVKQAREAIGLAIVMEQYAARLFGNGARPGGVVQIPGKADATTVSNMLTAWVSAFSGKGSGKPAILDNGAEYKQITLSSVDAQFAELRNFAITEIARAFRVPPVLLMDYARQTWTNAETGGQQFLTFALTPWIKRWEAEIRLKLFAPEQRDTFFAEFLVDDLLRADFDKRAKSYAFMISSRILSPNEVRARENLPPYVGGDEYVNPNTMSAAGTESQEQPHE